VREGFWIFTTEDTEVTEKSRRASMVSTTNLRGLTPAGCTCETHLHGLEVVLALTGTMKSARSAAGVAGSGGLTLLAG
jgi:hypothetical protein